MPKKTTPEEALNIVNEQCKKLNLSLTTKFEYISSRKTIFSVKCNSCGDEWETNYQNFITVKYCSTCHKKEAEQKLIDEVNERCKLTNITLMNKIDYNGTNTVLHLKCHCGYEWDTTHAVFVKRKSGCRKCNCKNQPSKLTQQEAELRVNSICQEKNYTHKPFVYKNNITELVIHCNKCEKDFSIRYNNLMTGKGCPHCAGNAKITQDEATQNVIEKCNGRFTINGVFEYKNNSSKIPLKCNTCNHTWHPSYSNFIHKDIGCPKCSKIMSAEKRKHDQEYIEDELKKRCGDEYTYEHFEYISATTENVYVTHKECGHSYLTSYHAFVIRGSGCPECSPNKPIGTEEALDNVLKRCAENNYTLRKPLNYKNNKTRVYLKCNTCGCEWKPTYNKFINKGTCCPDCSGYLPKESKHFKYFDATLPPSHKEYRFSDCRLKHMLPFDRYYDTLNLLFEYDGSHHFYEYKNLDPFELIQKRDSIKTEYAISHGYNFLRIKHTENPKKAFESYISVLKANPDKQVIQIYGEVEIRDKK